GRIGGKHLRALEADETGTTAAVHVKPVPSPEPVGAGSFVTDEPVLPEADYIEAVHGFIAQFGGLPNARQSRLFLAQYGVVDPVTGSVLTEGQLRPTLHDFKMQAPQPSAAGWSNRPKISRCGYRPWPTERMTKVHALAHWRTVTALPGCHD
ncbi:hypothetical protein AB0C64_44150, partial [Streptomyces sp900116325]